MSSTSSSRREPRHLSLFHQNSSNQKSNQLLNKMDTSKYVQAMDKYKRFLQMFENKIQKVCQKQNYRIYLNDRTNEKTYKSLIEQKNNLLVAIQQSKDYRKSANRQLIQQVMSLQKQRQQYMDRNNLIKKNIKNKKQQINRRRKQLRQLQKQIKSYWIYSYDLTGFSKNSNTLSNVSSICGGTGVRRRQNSGDCDDKQNDLNVTTNSGKNHNVSISTTLPIMINNDNTNYNDQRYHLPCISPKSHNTLSSSALISQPQSITVFAKQLSLINSSPTRQKVIGKINLSYQQQAQNKLSYQREKLSLLKMFCVYLKKMEQEQKGITDRLRLQRTANQLLQKISLKETKLNQIEKLINKK